MSESWLATVRRAAKLREREAAKAALRKHDGNIAAAAREPCGCVWMIVTREVSA